jgi:hypothetical protein
MLFIRCELVRIIKELVVLESRHTVTLKITVALKR